MSVSETGVKDAGEAEGMHAMRREEAHYIRLP